MTLEWTFYKPLWLDTIQSSQLMVVNCGFFKVYFTMYKSCMLIYWKKLGICLSKKSTFKDKPYIYISKSFYDCCQCYSKDRKTISHKNYFKTYPLKISSKLSKYVPMIPKIRVGDISVIQHDILLQLWHFAGWEKQSIQYFLRRL